MPSRFAYAMIAGGAVVGGMFIQGDMNFGSDHGRDVVIDRVLDSPERQVNRTVDRIVDRAADRIVVRGGDGRTIDADPAAKRALAAAVAELVRAEGSLIAVKLDDNVPASAIAQAEQRRDLAQQAVDRLADDVGGEARESDAGRTVRDEIRQEIREAARS